MAELGDRVDGIEMGTGTPGFPAHLRTFIPALSRREIARLMLLRWTLVSSKVSINRFVEVRPLGQRPRVHD